MGLTRRLILAAVGALMGMPMGVLAQTPTGYISAPTGAPVYVGPNTPLPVLTTTFSSTGSTTLSTGTTSANVALPGAGQYVEVTNGSSTVDAYVALGVGSGTVATSGGYLVKAGRSVFLSADGLSAGTATYIGGITLSSTASLTISTGNLVPVGGSGGPTTNVAITAPIGTGPPSQGVTTTLDSTDATALQNINANVQAPIPAGSNLIGKVGIDQTTNGSTNNVTVGVNTTGGALSFHLATSAASNNATLVSTGAHTLYDFEITTTATAVASVRLYDTAGSPTCSSATGVIRSYTVITTTGALGGLVVPIPPQGLKFVSGLAYCVTGAVADNDNTNAPTGVGLNGGYD